LFAGVIEPETSSRNQVARRRSLGGQPTRLEADEGQAVSWIPRARGHFGRDRERLLVLGVLVAEAEIVDELFDSDCIRGRKRALRQKPADIGIRGSVHVD
jgi:hypothetical protein